MILRPYGIMLEGHLELGLEIEMDGPRIVRVGPHTGIPDPFVVSPAFVNVHSHLEYRGFLGQLHGLEYWPWIRELTKLKSQDSLEGVKEMANTAARENRATGVALVFEHSDRPVAAQAMAAAGLQGHVFQEVITFLEQTAPTEKLALVAKRASDQSAFGLPVSPTPHALYTVDEATLGALGSQQPILSIHLGESVFERNFFMRGRGPIAELYTANGFPSRETGETPLQVARRLGLARSGVQFVHACDIQQEELDDLASMGVSVAHCPRSNVNLGCPQAPIREMLDLGMVVGLGLDSAASSGPIDMFEEMRAAMRLAHARGRSITAEQTWNMATTLGAQSLDGRAWRIEAGADVPLIKMQIPDAQRTEDLVEKGSPDRVEWVEI